MYLPPEAHDVAGLIKDLVVWITHRGGLPCPLVAGIAHYQYATIHPYYDGDEEQPDFLPPSSCIAEDTISKEFIL